MSYGATSPYYTTPILQGRYLDFMENRDIPADANDVYWMITSSYNLRPDLLAYDLYNDSRLWWVFAQRNPNRLQDPLFDFVAGRYIFVPQLDNLKILLGL